MMIGINILRYKQRECFLSKWNALLVASVDKSDRQYISYVNQYQFVMPKYKINQNLLSKKNLFKTIEDKV